jgi:hypothetical protein
MSRATATRRIRPKVQWGLRHPLRDAAALARGAVGQVELTSPSGGHHHGGVKSRRRSGSIRVARGGVETSLGRLRVRTMEKTRRGGGRGGSSCPRAP